MFKHIRNCLMSNILLTRQSNLSWHFFNTLKQLRRSSGTVPACLLSLVFVQWQGLKFASMSMDAYKQMSMGVSNITSIGLVTLEMIYNALLISEWRLWFAWWELLGNLGTCKHWLDSSLELRSFNCIFTILADSRSLKGTKTRVVSSVVAWLVSDPWI